MAGFFWKMSEPKYDSDYRRSYINGDLEHPFGLPGVSCETCGETFGGCKILSHACPPSLRQHKNLRDGWPISRLDHQQLQMDVFKELGMAGKPFVDLTPGCSFQPCFLDIPSRPRADFLWPSLGSFIVRDRIRNLLLDLCEDEIIACPVIMRKVGKRSPKLSTPMPSTGEPEDIINEVPLLDETEDVPKYWEILVLNESGFPPGGTPISICTGCRRPTIGKEREIRMTPHMWKGHKIFFLATTLHTVVTNRLRKAIDALRPTNVQFVPI